MFTAVSRALHFSSESGASKPRDCRFYKHRKGSVLRASCPGKIDLEKTMVLGKLKKSGHVVVLYRGGKSCGRYPVASFGKSFLGCSGGEERRKSNSRKETHDGSKTGIIVVRWKEKVKIKAKQFGGENRWAVSTWIGLRLGSELSS
jgi:hypothetical protein